ncbi:MAG: hypothetical protein FJ098_00940 [Deltaproteobacteria bacterium]|nr:hypothetical protein [Deltaproteobacteria bacterium]
MVMAGCAPEGNPEALVILGNAWVAGGDCRPGSGSSGAYRSIGTLDLLMSTNYFMFPYVANELPGTSEVTEIDPMEGGLDSSTVALTGARIWYEIDGLQGSFVGGPTELPDEVFSPTSGTVRGMTEAVVQIEAIPSSVIQLLDQDNAFDTLYSGGYLIVHIAFEGRKLDGTKVRSGEFVYPIQVCRGCLMYWPMDPEQCCADNIPTLGEICFPGQDEGVPCDVGCFLVQADERAEAKQAMIEKKTVSLNAAGQGGGTEDDVEEQDTL